jgi:hypothetical protein
MSDISKCADSFCPSKDHCYRFKGVTGMAELQRFPEEGETVL